MNKYYAAFAGDEEQQGRQAEAVKELVGVGETNLVNRTLEIQQQISDAGMHIRESNVKILIVSGIGL